MKNRKKWLCLVLCLLLMVNVFPTLFAEEAEATDDLQVTTTIIEFEEYGNAVLDISIEDFEDAGYNLGDVVTVKTENYDGEMPYFNGYYVEKGEYLLCAYPGTENIAVCINYGNFAEAADAEIGDSVIITLKEDDGALAQQKINNLVYTNNRSDYSLDRVFANFRPVVMGNLAEGKLFRSASPVDNSFGRAAFANELAELVRVNAVMNLANTEEEVLEEFERGDFCSDYYRTLYEDGRVIALGMPIAFETEEFAQGIVRGLTFLAEQEPPYLVHCTEGKDRAGFASMVLEALMGASVDEIVADYMVSYENYYGIQQGTEQYDLIVSKNIMLMLPIIAGTDDLENVDLAAATESYLLNNGMDRKSLDSLKEKLSKPSAPGPALPTASAEEADSSADDIRNRRLTEDELAIAVHVIENFVALSQVPRPSHHEEKVSAFFMEWAREQGLEPRQDEVLNVIFDVPATKGYENYPMVGLQAHMDMVCVGDSPDYDPEIDPIKVVVDYDNATMTADGTSLGADDGIGCAIIMSMVQGLKPHGPLRVIITVDEEDQMTGIQNLDASTVEDLKYLINVDSETSDTVTVSTAGGVEIDISCEGAEGKAPEGDLAVKVSVSGLAGGHSGVDINKGRLNAILVLDSVLEELAAGGVSFEIASMEGGTASNAIPSKAEAILMIHEEDLEKVVSVAEKQEAAWKAEYESTEPNLSISASAGDAVWETVVSPELADKTHALLDGLVNGVYSMSEDVEGLVESSSNLGVLRLSPEELTICCYERSSSGEKQEEILAIDRKVIEENGLDAEFLPSGDPWPYNPYSVLLPLTQEVYLEQNGSEIKAEAIHATLECGTFSVMNPDLDMVSIGPDLVDVHSTGEMLYLLTIPKTFSLLAGILDGIAEADANGAENPASAA